MTFADPVADHFRAADAGRLLLTDRYQAALRRLADRHSLIVDLDDTLNTNQPLYTDAHAALREVFSALDPNGPAEGPMIYTKRCREINNEHLPALGYTPKRWRLCAQLTAAEIAGRPLTGQEAEQVAQAAEIALGVGELYPGVRDVLTALRNAGVRMLLKTKGEREIQTRKIIAHRMRDFFGEQIEIVDTKNADTMRAMAAKHGLHNPVSIGDSRASDVQPALDCGFRGLLIDHGWRWDDPAYNDPTLPKVGSFAEAVLTLADEMLADEQPAG